METKTIEAVTAKTNDLLAAPSCNPTLKAEANKWLAAAEKDAETPAYIDALKNGVATIDELIGFASSDHAKKLMGEEAAAGLLAHAKDIKAKGAKYCDCPACTAALAILDILHAI